MCTPAFGRRSYAAETEKTYAVDTKIKATPMAVLRRQCTGSGHQPPDGDHTYLGYGNLPPAPIASHAVALAIAPENRKRGEKKKSSWCGRAVRMMATFGRKRSGGALAPLTNAQIITQPPITHVQPTQVVKKRRQLHLTDLGIDCRRTRTTCALCLFPYRRGDTAEERMHARHHAKWDVANFKWDMLAAFVVAGDESAPIVRLPSNALGADGSDASGSRALPKIRQGVAMLSAILENELGALPLGDQLRGQAGAGVAVFVHLDSTGRLAAALVAEVLGQSHSVTTGAGQAWVAAPAAGAMCGVRYMWTAQVHRRRGAMTRLVDACRLCLVPFRPLGRRNVAFCEPSEDGKGFAQRYTGLGSSYLVYAMAAAGRRSTRP